MEQIPKEIDVSSDQVDATATVVLESRSLCWPSQYYTVEAVLGRHPGVRSVEVNPVAQSAMVTFDVNQTSIAELSRVIRKCGCICGGSSVPIHLSDRVPGDRKSVV